jgi:hypothetical protein
VAENVDRFIFTLPQEITSQIGLLFGVVENITFMDLQYRRFTRLDPAGKIGYLERLNSIGSELRTVYNALREFCMLGYYQQESSWEKMGYAGPMVDGSVRERHIRYSSLVAPPGKLPKSIATI